MHEKENIAGEGNALHVFSQRMELVMRKEKKRRRTAGVFLSKKITKRKKLQRQKIALKPPLFKSSVGGAPDTMGSLPSMKSL